ncbi:MAG TPA: glutamyl-tRNA reductase, partial [Rhodothermales bacterium]|nr:glutamyl-tRNA reductase [Rhodothermales bacterium]
MTFFVFGLNHETAPVAVRETFALDEAALRMLYRTVSLTADAEWIVLSTCNRTEVYLYGTRSDVAQIQQTMAAGARQVWPEAQAFLLEDEPAILHVLAVTTGLKSLVLGDGQILSQVKDAYRLAAGEERVGAVMHRLMHTAFRTAKRVINETHLTSGTASVAAAAVDHAARFFDQTTEAGLEGRSVMLIGAGRMGRLALEALSTYHPCFITIANRTPVRAEALAKSCKARVVAWDDRYAALAEADWVIVASGATEPVLCASHMPERSAETPQLLVDIAVPRNIEPGINNLPDYAVIDLDTLNENLVQVEALRRSEVPAAQALCEEALTEYVSWFFHQQALQPAIHAIRETFETIRLQEIERHHHRLSDLDRAELDRLTTSIIQKLLAVPVVRLKNVDPDSIDFTRGIQLLEALFSRPDCEEALPERTDATCETLPSENPALCPFEPKENLPDDLKAQLQAALRVPR